MEQTLQTLIRFFENSQPPQIFMPKLFNQTSQQCQIRSQIKQFQKLFQQCLSSGKQMISIFTQKCKQKDEQNQTLMEQITQQKHKQQILFQQSQKLSQQNQSNIIDLRNELIKQEQIRKELEQYFQRLEQDKSQLSHQITIKNKQMQQFQQYYQNVIKQVNKQYIKLKEKLIDKQRQNQILILNNQGLYNEIYQLSKQIDTLREKNQNFRECVQSPVRGQINKSNELQHNNNMSPVYYYEDKYGYGDENYNILNIHNLQNSKNNKYKKINIKTNSKLKKTGLEQQDQNNEESYQNTYNEHQTYQTNVLRDMLNNSAEFHYINTSRELFISKKKYNKEQQIMDCYTNSAKSIIRYQESSQKKYNQKLKNTIKSKIQSTIKINQIKNQVIYQSNLDQHPEIKIKQFAISDHTNNRFDPYLAFFTIMAQCIKINSRFFDRLAALDVSKEWDYLIQNRIALHEWQSHLKLSMSIMINETDI